MDLGDFIKLAYSLYPGTLNEGQEYDKTPEYQQLKERIARGKDVLQDRWNLILGDMQQLFPGVLTVFRLPANSEDRCFKLEIRLASNKLICDIANDRWKTIYGGNLPHPVSLGPEVYYEETLIVYVSLIIPYFSFCLMRSIHRLGLREKSFNIDNRMHALQRAGAILSERLPEFERFPAYYSYFVLDGIQFDRSTYCYEDQYDQQISAMTLFNAFFTSHPVL